MLLITFIIDELSGLYFFSFRSSISLKNLFLKLFKNLFISVMKLNSLVSFIFFDKYNSSIILKN